MATRAIGLALVLADGTTPPRALLDAAWPGWDADLALVIAADGGARHAAALGLRVDRWVGDGDSIEPAALEALAATGAVIDRVAAEKDEADSELALLAAIDAGASRITILGGLGGLRVDHALANVGLLGHPRLQGRPVVLFDEHAARISLLVAGAAAPDEPAEIEHDLAGRAGDLVTLMPFGEPVTGVTTTGLRYPLAGETLELGRTRGISNVRMEPRARVRLTSGRLLVIETPANLGS